jgi:hypothetical protein
MGQASRQDQTKANQGQRESSLVTGVEGSALMGIGSQGGELLTHLLILLTQQPYLFPLLPYLLLLSQDECPGISRPRQPVGF